MDSTNSEEAANSRYTATISQDDQLDRCEQLSEIKARILELERNREYTRERREKFTKNREQRLKNSRDISLSISNNASAIFSTPKSHKALDEQVSRYQSIANLTQQQNTNLKNQNDYLLSKLKSMRQKQKKFLKIAQKAQKYKSLFQQAEKQLEIAKQECQAYRQKAQEMKKIALLDVGRLEDKILPFVKTLDETQSIASWVAGQKEIGYERDQANGKLRQIKEF